MVLPKGMSMESLTTSFRDDCPVSDQQHYCSNEYGGYPSLGYFCDVFADYVYYGTYYERKCKIVHFESSFLCKIYLKVSLPLIYKGREVLLSK